MSVAALTMDEQRLNSYNKSNANPANPAGFVSGPASPQSPQQYHQQQHQHQQQQQSFNAEQRLLEEIETLKDEQARLVQQYADSQRREKILTRRLANKEQEFQDYVSQIAEYKAAQAPSAVALRSALLDPAVNLLFEKLKKELKATKAKLEETQNELSAWKFTPDSNTGKRLMAKCRLLYQENEELGKMTSSGRLAKLETELAMQKSFSEEVKKSQSELDDFLQELDEDVEGMQSTILFLQQELKTTRERIILLEKENYQLKNDGIMDVEGIHKGNNEIEQNDNLTTNAQQQQHTAHHAGLNGNDVLTKMVSSGSNNINQEAINSSSSSYQQNDMKFQTTNAVVVGNNKLTPIQEEPCVRVSAYTCGGGGSGNDDGFYNGNTADEHDNGSNTVTASRALRAPSTRKRAYDSLEVNETTNANIDGDSAGTPTIPPTTTVAVAAPHIPIQLPHTITQVVAPPAPRILPPKKSKLRMTPPTIQHTDISLMEHDGVNSGVNNSVALNALAAAADNVGIATASDEIINIANTNEEHTGNGSGGIPQRIMTRRRSMRTQQNGA